MLIEIEGKKLIEHTYAQLAASAMDELVIVTGRDADEVAGLFPKQSSIIHNPDFEQGMTGSIQAGVRHSSEAHAYMICLGDMLWLKTGHYNALIEQAKVSIEADEQAIVMPRVNGRPGNPVIFSSHYKADILAHTESNGCKKIVQQNRQHLVYLESTEVAYLKDVDTPADLEKLNQ